MLKIEQGREQLFPNKTKVMVNHNEGPVKRGDVGIVVFYIYGLYAVYFPQHKDKFRGIEHIRIRKKYRKSSTWFYDFELQTANYVSLKEA